VVVVSGTVVKESNIYIHTRDLGRGTNVAAAAGRKVLLAVGKNMCPEINGALLLRRRRGPSAAMRNARGRSLTLYMYTVYILYHTLPSRRERF